jgi:RNA polymerase II subunit A small phosphatase-like protein
MSKYYELIIYTASLSKYADPLMDLLDPHRFCSQRLFREHCTSVNGTYVKDMSKIGRNIKDAILLDNSPNSYAFQPENAVPILSWYDDFSDVELVDIIPFFKKLSTIDDVRPILRRATMNNQIDYDYAISLIEHHKQYLRDKSVPV